MRGALQQRLGYRPQSKAQPGFVWLNELIWREFYRHLLVLIPSLSMNRPFKPETAAPAVELGSRCLRRLVRGRTGYPVVDAAMRCLNATGWMHNRLRMIVASFLTKDLHIHWRLGEDYFMSRLIDGDLAANNGGWQWAAGTGADAAPYFRVFNPTTQGNDLIHKGSSFVPGSLSWRMCLLPISTSPTTGCGSRGGRIIRPPWWIMPLHG